MLLGKTSLEKHQKSAEQESYPQRLSPSQEAPAPGNQAPHWITAPRKRMNNDGLLLSYFLPGLHYYTCQNEMLSYKSSDVLSSHGLAVALERPNQYVFSLLAIYNSVSWTFLSILFYALIEKFYWFVRLHVCLHWICAMLCGLLRT